MMKPYTENEMLFQQSVNLDYCSLLEKDGMKDAIISFSQPLQLLHNDSFLKEIVEERFVFFNKNYRKYQSLTEREREILSMIANGDNNKTIAEKLFISFHTVKTHRKNICYKLDTGKLIELVKFAQVFLMNKYPLGGMCFTRNIL